MSYSEVAPSTAVLNGGSDTPKTVVPNTTTPKKSTTIKNTQQIIKPQILSKAEVTPNTQPKTVETVQQPVSNHQVDQSVSFWEDLGIPLMLVIILFVTFFYVMARWSTKHPVVGYAHRHARAGGPSHNTPGKMQPRIFK